MHCESRRVRLRECEFEKIEINNMLKMEFVKPVEAELWASFVFTPMKRGLLRFFIDCW